MHKSFFITGTDTGVGKTYVAAGLIKAFRTMGLRVCPMKPVETGCRVRRGKLLPSDTRLLIRTSGVKEDLEMINPYRYGPPLAPSVAANMEGDVIGRRRIIDSYHLLKRKYDITIVEGAGGVMVPLQDKYFFIDLIKDLDIPVLIIARPGLGTINHTLLTLDALRRRGIRIIGVVINYCERRRGLAERTSTETMRQTGRVNLFGVVPHKATKNSAARGAVFNELGEKILSALQIN